MSKVASTLIKICGVNISGSNIYVENKYLCCVRCSVFAVRRAQLPTYRRSGNAQRTTNSQHNINIYIRRKYLSLWT